MATTPIDPAASVNVPTPPPAITITGGSVQDVTNILQDALNVLDLIPSTAMYAGLAQVIIGIIGAAVNRIKAQTGKPIDLSNIPSEQPLP